MTDFQIAGETCRALRHGMAGEVGFEIFGPWEEGNAVRDAILKAGRNSACCASDRLPILLRTWQSGWIPRSAAGNLQPRKPEAYREWLSPSRQAGILAGSLYTQDITDYYVTPFDLGYGRLVKFDS